MSKSSFYLNNKITKVQKQWFDYTRFIRNRAKKSAIKGMVKGSPFIELLDWVGEKFHEAEHKKIDAVLESCKSFVDINVSDAENKKIIDSYVRLADKCAERYKLVRHFDEDIFRPYHTDKDADDLCEEAINYMNVIDVSYPNLNYSIVPE